MMAKKARVKKAKKGKGRWQRAILGILLALIMIGSAVTALTQL